MTADLAVSIVSYRTPDLLRRCLSELEGQRHDLELQVIVVDNASDDGSAELVEHEFPWMRVLRNETNVGFGAAHNQALRQADARHFLVLNSDAAPRPGALPTLVAYLDANPGVAVVGPTLRYPDGTVQPSRRRFPTVPTLFFESTQLQRVWPDNAILRRYYVADRHDDTEQDVDWLVGACLCVRARAAAEVGLFDERFFMYSEEIDWCRRFRQAGWRVVYLPSAEVMHQEGASSGLDLAHRDRQFQKSKLQYAAKWHGARVAGALRAYLVLEYAVRGVEEVGKLALGSRVAERRARLRVIGSGMRHALHG
jgi:N-acetylglucosaminyl-diphospho-decaprenol L-rhamnosyltransferase